MKTYMYEICAVCSKEEGKGNWSRPRAQMAIMWTMKEPADPQGAVNLLEAPEACRRVELQA